MATLKRNRNRLSLEVNFKSEEQKDAFSHKMNAVKKLLTPPGKKTIDNLGLFSTLFDMVSQQETPTSSHPPTFTTKSFLPNSGKLCLLDCLRKQVMLNIFVCRYIRRSCFLQLCWGRIVHHREAMLL